MCDSMIRADRRTHGRIVAVAFVGAISLIMLAGAAWRAQTDASTAPARANGPILHVGKPTISAAVAVPVIR